MKSFSLGSEKIFFRDPAVIKVEFTGIGTPPHQLAMHRPGFKPLGSSFDQDATEFLLAGFPDTSPG